MANGKRYNLLNSAIIELFEYITAVSHVATCIHGCPDDIPLLYSSSPLPVPPPSFPQEKLKTLMEYVMENFMPTLEGVAYVDTFKKLKLRHEQIVEGKDSKPEPAV